MRFSGLWNLSFKVWSSESEVQTQTRPVSWRVRKWWNVLQCSVTTASPSFLRPSPGQIVWDSLSSHSFLFAKVDVCVCYECVMFTQICEVWLLTRFWLGALGCKSDARYDLECAFRNAIWMKICWCSRSCLAGKKTGVSAETVSSSRKKSRRPKSRQPNLYTFVR